ncbi:uncharacterized protein EI97DRAFT_439301 [Westerdykella ornata]|uniref:Uncharacterized protein n=1 Tax=Westerdykella ornata TaxID=318751 RepID=A0A6A6JUJ1_WESOR|nr:uncharacterized protein EI97DRAFT_439301 [Westerdykella ornata]KAF2280252.1 hypothetical protein EI97DRAFT_439301 [Westerdykella ornata]
MTPAKALLTPLHVVSSSITITTFRQASVFSKSSRRKADHHAPQIMLHFPGFSAWASGASCAQRHGPGVDCGVYARRGRDWTVRLKGSCWSLGQSPLMTLRSQLLLIVVALENPTAFT